MAGQRGGLTRHSLHHASVAANGVHVEINQVFEVRFIKVVGFPTFGESHAHASRDTLAQWTGGGLDSGGPTIFRMAWASATQLAKFLNRIQRYRGFAQRFVILTDSLHAR